MEPSSPERMPNQPAHPVEYSPIPQSGEHASGESPERAPEQSPERNQEQHRATTSAAPASAPALQLPQPVPQAAPTQAVDDDDDLPAVAGDEDLIEKEWVDKAKKIIAETRDDPHAREQQVNKLQIDYLQKRYGKTLGSTE